MLQLSEAAVLSGYEIENHVQEANGGRRYQNLNFVTTKNYKGKYSNLS